VAVKHITGTIARDGVKLFTQAWLPDGETPDGALRAVVFLVHGLAEHSGRYAHVGAFLAARGYAVYTMDLRGHGRSDGLRGYIAHTDVFLDDLHAYFQQVQAANPGRTIFILGHSMGAVLALIFAGRHQAELAGVVTSGAVIMAGAAIPGYIKLIAQVLSAVAPKAPVQALEAGTVSRDPAVCAAYDSDPLNYRGKIRARLGAELLTMGPRAVEAARGLTIPALVMHGAADTLSDPAGLDLLDQAMTMGDKTVRRWEGLYHEIFNEPEQAEVLGFVADWLDAHTGEERQGGTDDTDGTRIHTDKDIVRG
jgi:acylglycerol lipase